MELKDFLNDYLKVGKKELRKLNLKALGIVTLMGLGLGYGCIKLSEIYEEIGYGKAWMKITMEFLTEKNEESE